MGPATLKETTWNARVLIVEDEGLVAKDLSLMVQTLGYEVAGIAASGEKALALAHSEQPDVVLMDIRLRGNRDGIQVAEEIREQSGAAIIYVTAYADDATLDRAKITEPAGYIVKPFSASDLRATLGITLQRQRTQRRQEEREGRLSAVVRRLSDAVLVCDQDGKVKLLNPAAEILTGMRAAEACGKRPSELFEFRSEKRIDDRISETDPAGTAGTLISQDGTRRQVLCSVARVHHERSGETETLMVIRDVTELERTAKALQERNGELGRTNEALAQGFRSLYHDLKEPLHTISLASEVLTRDADAGVEESRREYLACITEGCMRMQLMVTSLLNYYLATAVDAPPAISVNSADALRNALLNLSGAIRAAGAIVKSTSMPEEVFTQPIVLLQVFQNLIQNALKYRRDITPQIEISATREGDFWTFTVADNGTGFSPSLGDRIFTLYARGEEAQTEGSGMGLATCRKLVEQFGGRIWAESRVGEGSQFHFTLPATPAVRAATA